MKCRIKYRSIIRNTHPEDRKALLESYLTGDGYCPACRRDGRLRQIEERFGETV